MEINHIFGNVYAVKYNKYAVNEFRRLFNNWNNAEYLQTFFDEYVEDLIQNFTEEK